MYLNYLLPIQSEYELVFPQPLKSPRIVHAMMLTESGVHEYPIVRVNCDMLETADFNNYIDELLFTKTSSASKVFLEKHYSILCKQDVHRTRFWLSDIHGNPVRLPCTLYLSISIKIE